MFSERLEAWNIDKSNRKELIFKNFHNMPEGENFVLAHKKDPIPLHKLFEKELPGKFEWEYIKNGPDLFEVKISKVKRNDFTVNELINRFPAAVHVLTKHDLKYFMNGKHKLNEIIADPRISVVDLVNEMKEESERLGYRMHFEIWSIEHLISFIIENFHKPHRKQISEIHHLISHMELAHFDSHPEFFLIKDEFNEFSEDLLEHLNDEEEKLFPYILQMQQLSKLQIEDLGSTMNWLEEDHMLTADRLQKMQQLCDNYKPGKSGFPAMKLMYQELFNLQKDLQFHIYIENNVLFEKVRHFFVNP